MAAGAGAGGAAANAQLLAQWQQRAANTKPYQELVGVVTAMYDMTGFDAAANQRRLEARNAASAAIALPNAMPLFVQCFVMAAETHAAEQYLVHFAASLKQAIELKYHTLAEPDRAQMRVQLMQIACGIVPRLPQKASVKGTLALCLVRMFNADFPHAWKDFFGGFLRALDSGGLELIDLFMRVLRGIDQEIFEAKDGRSQQEIARNTAIKDQMRATEMKPIVEAIFKILTLTDKSPQTLPIAESCLHTLSEYIPWINIAFVATPNFVKLMYGYWKTGALQCRACDCLLQIVHKKMAVDAKWPLLCMMQLPQTLDAAVASAPNRSPAVFGAEFAEKCAHLLSEVTTQIANGATELREVVAKAQRQPTEPEAKAFADMTAAIEQVLPLAFKFLDHPHLPVRVHVSNVFSQWVNRTLKNTTAPVAGKELQCFQLVFAGMSKCLVYPANYNFDKADDKEDDFRRVTNDVLNVLRAQMRLQPDTALALVLARVTEVMKALQSVAANQLEAALRLLDLFGESNTKLIPERLKAGPLAQVLDGIVKSELRNHPNAQVLIAYFALLARYTSLFDLYPQLLGPGLSPLMDAHGMKHQNPAVRNAACACLHTLFTRFLPATRAQLKSVAGAAIKQLTAVVGSTFEVDVARAGQVKPHISDAASIDLCEVIGTLCTSTCAGAENCQSYFVTVNSVFVQLLKQALAQRHAWLQRDPEVAGRLLSHLLRGMTTFQKPLKEDHAKVAEYVFAAFPTAAELLTMLPQNGAVWREVVNAVHRLLELCPVEKALEVLPQPLSNLLATATAASIHGYVALLDQLMIKGRGGGGAQAGANADVSAPNKAAALVDVLYQPVLKRLLEFIGSYGFVDDAAAAGTAGYSAQKKERFDLQRAYYQFLLKLTATGLCGVIWSAKNAGASKETMERLVAGLTPQPDADYLKVNQNCYAVVHNIVTWWHAQLCAQLPPQQPVVGADGKPLVPQPPPVVVLDAGRQAFVFGEVLRRGFAFAMSPHVNPMDATTAQVFGEFCDVQKSCAQFFGPPYVKALGEYLMAQFKCSAPMAEQYLAPLLKGATPTAFRGVFRNFIVAARQALGIAYGAGAGKAQVSPQKSPQRSPQQNGMAAAGAGAGAGAAGAAGAVGQQMPMFGLGASPVRLG